MSSPARPALTVYRVHHVASYRGRGGQLQLVRKEEHVVAAPDGETALREARALTEKAIAEVLTGAEKRVKGSLTATYDLFYFETVGILSNQDAQGD